MSRFLGALFFWALTAGFGVEAVSACDRETVAWRMMSEGRVTIQLDEGTTHHLEVKIAMTPAQRAAGYQHICSKQVRAWGLLFVFQFSERHTFHMRNVREDLDIAFIAKDGRILELKKMFQEERSARSYRYRAAQPYKYVLEAAAGRLSGLGLEEGNWWLVLDPSWN